MRPTPTGSDEGSGKLKIEEERAAVLLEMIGRYAGAADEMLEVGCRSGANLATLYRAGYTRLTGVEEDPRRLEEFRRLHPGAWEAAVTSAGDVTALVQGFADREFHLVFSVGYFFDHEGDFSVLRREMARVTGGYLLSIESEGGPDGPDYSELYAPYGLKEVESVELKTMPALESVFTARVLKKLTP